MPFFSFFLQKLGRRGERKRGISFFFLSSFDKESRWRGVGKWRCFFFFYSVFWKIEEEKGVCIWVISQQEDRKKRKKKKFDSVSSLKFEIKKKEKNEDFRVFFSFWSPFLFFFINKKEKSSFFPSILSILLKIKKIRKLPTPIFFHTYYEQKIWRKRGEKWMNSVVFSSNFLFYFALIFRTPPIRAEY